MFDLMEDEQVPAEFRTDRYASPPPSSLPEDPHIPQRIRRAAAGHSAAPDPTWMDDEEYAESIRYGMWRRQHGDELKRAEQAEHARRDHAARQAKLNDELRQQEAERIRALQQQKGRAEQAKRVKELDDYLAKWRKLPRVSQQPREHDDEIQPLRWVDMPWPVLLGSDTATLHPTMLEPDRITQFFTALHEHSRGDHDTAVTDSTTTTATTTLRKILRDAILAYHPDRFIGRYLHRVVEHERDMVRDAVIRCSQIINEFASEIK